MQIMRSKRSLVHLYISSGKTIVQTSEEIGTPEITSGRKEEEVQVRLHPARLPPATKRKSNKIVRLGE